MARLAVIFTVILSLFILSHARISFDLPDNRLTEWKSISTSSDSNTEETILLPSEATESDSIPLEVVSESEPKSMAAIGINRPSTMTYDISFRPINRHFHHMPMKRPFWYRFPHRCRHHGKPIVGPQFTAREISYGNDMLMSDKTTFDPKFHGDVRHIPARWSDFHGERRRFPIKPVRFHEGSLTEMEFKKPRHVEQEEEVKIMESMDEYKEEGGFMEQFRKFLNHF